MYTLTLTQSERQAIDWIGNRYAHGDDLYHHLWVMSWVDQEDAEWDSPCNIAFCIPENVAWGICEIVEADSLVCFSDALASKLRHFCEGVV